MVKNLSVQNNFTRGLITEATGLNFPENACTDTSNCVFSLIGDVTRRPGIDLEDNFRFNSFTVGQASTNYRWRNAGGDGQTEILVSQSGSTLFFYQSTNSTVTNPLSQTILSSTVNVATHQALNNTANVALTECQFASGNGYLFVFHPDCDPFYCTFNSGVINSNTITLQTRDFLGFYPEPGNPSVSLRPTSLTNEHNYNLQNQGWTGVPSWVANSNNNPVVTYMNNTGPGWYIVAENQNFTVQSGLSSVSPGQFVNISYAIFDTTNGASGGTGNLPGTVISYTGTTLEIDILQNSSNYLLPNFNPSSHPYIINFTITPGATNNAISTFHTAVSIYPSNSDIWYTFKDSTGTFVPTTTYGNVLPTSSQAPMGHFILDTFNQKQTSTSGISGLTNISTTMRPGTGCWFQGRVWYAGVNSSQVASGDQNFYTWSENVYFSQVNQANDVTTFGYCYQENDPTDENLFDLLPTDGGVITIQGCGNIYKLFPIQNGLIVFARNGVWFITGAQGLGFTATNYTITKISSVQSISSTSYVDVLGFPMFWNEEGIYKVTTSKDNTPYGFGGLIVEPLTVGTILSFYTQIPLDSKLYARGDYDPINYVIKWVYKSTEETGIIDRYEFDSVLNFNIYNKAFYPYRLSPGMFVSDLFYLNYPNSSAPDPTFKYVVIKTGNISFAEEKDRTNWVDWFSQITGGVNYTSYFVTGYSLHGKGIMKWQPTYIYMYSRNDLPFSYTIQGVWDYSINMNSGRNTTVQTVVNNLGQPNFGTLFRRHKIRGHGTVLQFTVSSVQGQPFDILGWTVMEAIDQGV